MKVELPHSRPLTAYWHANRIPLLDAISKAYLYLMQSHTFYFGDDSAVAADQFG